MADIKKIIITVLVFTGFGLALFQLAGDLTSNYGVNFDEDFANTEQKLNDTLRGTKSFTDEFANRTESSEGLTVFNGVAVVGKSLLAAVRLPFQAIGLTGTLLSDILGKIPSPDWVLPVIMGVITITIIAAVLAVIINRNRI